MQSRIANKIILNWLGRSEKIRHKLISQEIEDKIRKKAVFLHETAFRNFIKETTIIVVLNEISWKFLTIFVFF